ncbi:MAG: hypothetical protein ACXVP7_03945 [Actinomycetota bacterium]
MTDDLERDLQPLLTAKAAEAAGAPIAPNDILRRARRRQMRNVVFVSALAVVLIGGAIGGAMTISSHETHRTPGATGQRSFDLPTEGPNPGQTSLVLATGVQDGQGWTLRATSDPTAGLGLDFGYDGLGSGGSDLSPIRPGETFRGYGGSSSPEYPNNDRTKPPLPMAINGEVTADTATVDLRLDWGSTIHAEIYPVPDELVGGVKAFVAFVPADVLVKAGDLIAYDEAGNEIGRTYLDLSPLSLYPKVMEQSSPQAVAVMKELQLAGAVVGRYFDVHGSFSGLSPQTASAISSQVAYNTSETAIAGEVSIRVSGPQRLVLASVTPDGDVYSACFGYGPSADLYGRNDTSDPFGCTNGWLNPSGSPFPNSMKVIASGNDAVGGLWDLTLIPTDTETDLEFTIGTLQTDMPLHALGADDIGRPAVVGEDEAMSPGPLPTAVYGVASERVARMELRMDDGRVFVPDLYPIPPGTFDVAQAFIVLVPRNERVSGTLIAFDASDGVLQRQTVAAVPVPIPSPQG